MAVVVTVALVPVASAYLQLSYTAPESSSPGTHETRSTVRALDQAVAGGAAEVAGEYEWSERTAAVRTLRSDLGSRFEGIEDSGEASTTSTVVSYNRSLASHVAATRCPRGAGRAFGDCEAHQGIVVQERAGETVVLAVALDVTVVTPNGDVHVTHRFDA